LVEDFENYNNELQDGAYIKDLNNVLDKYVGTWKGVYDTKNYEFEVIKFTEEHTDGILNYKEDLLLIRYKVTTNSGTELVNTLNLSNNHMHTINGSYLTTNGTYVLSYLGTKGECGQNGTVYISVSGTNNNTMRLGLYVDGEIYPECTTGPAEEILSTTGILLIKQ
jgi:hypothetical protein